MFSKIHVPYRRAHLRSALVPEGGRRGTSQEQGGAHGNMLTPPEGGSTDTPWEKLSRDPEETGREVNTFRK